MPIRAVRFVRLQSGRLFGLQSNSIHPYSFGGSCTVKLEGLKNGLAGEGCLREVGPFAANTLPRTGDFAPHPPLSAHWAYLTQPIDFVQFRHAISIACRYASLSTLRGRSLQCARAPSPPGVEGEARVCPPPINTSPFRVLRDFPVLGTFPLLGNFCLPNCHRAISPALLPRWRWHWANFA